MPRAEQIEIRRLSDQDVHEFYRLRLEALETEPHAFAEAPEEHRGITLDSIERMASDTDDIHNVVLGATVDEALVGMAGLAQYSGLKTKHKAKIWGLYVTPAWRRKGVARVLVAELLQRARAIPDVVQVVLSVGTEQVAARQLYLSLGFEVYGKESRALKVGGEYVDEDLMLLRISR